MKMKSLVSACTLVLLAATMAMAQTLEIDEPKQLTFLQAGINSVPSAATNGSEWGVAYTRKDNTGNLYFLRTTYDGVTIESRQILQGDDGDSGYSSPTVAAYPGGWVLTTRYLDNGGGTSKVDNYLVILDKSGRKIGPPVLIVGDESTARALPIWTGSMFMVFYSKKTETGYKSGWIAYFDAKGKRIGSDRRVTEPLNRNFAFSKVVPTSKGFRLFISDSESGSSSTDPMDYFLLEIGLDGMAIAAPMYLSVATSPFVSRLHTALWNGKGYAMAARDYDPADHISTLFARLVSTTGSWQSSKFVQKTNGITHILGLAFNGTQYASFALNKDNDTVFVQQLDDKMRAVGTLLTVDDSRATATYNRVASVGSDAFYFATAKKVGFSPKAWNLYLSRVRFPHSGKPKVTFFNGAVHKFQGKKYAFFDWHVAGAEQVTMKTKGKRWTLPASGFHAVEIKKDAKFKIVASNKSGSAKAKVKVKIKN